ncbi:protein translocase subunit SecD [Candidatus Amarobacter glycogenicus]|uniref:protein translocase subunit SecD n=1 Tax=Candidatus Amarobacter glycogenicus TaxID=3140699 RepID=UPI0031CC95E3
MRSTSTVFVFLFVVALTAFSVIVVWPSSPYRYLPGDFWPHGRGIKLGDWERETMRLGLDLQGGAYLILQADPPADYQGDLGTALDSAKNVVERRVNEFGVSEAEINKTSGNRISVQVPGLSLQEAQDLIGKTAALKFMVYDDNQQLVEASGVIDGQTIAMTGADIKNNTYAQNIGTTFAVVFETTSRGSKLMDQITRRALSYPSSDPRNYLIVMLDDVVLSQASVSGIISDSGQITGQASFSEANNLSKQLNAGALPVPLKIIQAEEVSATLGEDSVLDSVRAGQVGLLAVMLFMILYYRLPGVLASAALLVYTAITLMVFKLVPITLTLSGIAAFVLSIGIAVDANILIFERMKEELRRGRTLNAAIDIGFRRAWSSIRDSNVSTLITCTILYYFGANFGAAVVQGFALTLAIGVLISMFSAITVTRTFLRMVLGTPLAKNHFLFNADEVKKTAPSARRAGMTSEEQGNA